MVFLSVKNDSKSKILVFSITVVLDIVLGITCITIVHGDILWAAQRGMKSDMAKYSSEPLAKFKVDVLQNKYRCCGVASYRDWFSVPWQQYTSKYDLALDLGNVCIGPGQIASIINRN